MKRLWAPWRARFFDRPKPRGCIFCRLARSRRDREHFILRRLPLTFVMLNLYPYNNGHVLIAPYRHVARMDDLAEAELHEMVGEAGRMVKVLGKAFRPDGFNMGLNLGRAAGAGLPGHIHVHVVPRWRADTNFMPLLAGTKVISESLGKTYQRILSYGDKRGKKPRAGRGR